VVDCPVWLDSSPLLDPDPLGRLVLPPLPWLPDELLAPVPVCEWSLPVPVCEWSVLPVREWPVAEASVDSLFDAALEDGPDDSV
jgi:hypothetical protein